MKKNAVYIINSLQNGGAERVILTQAEYLLSKDIEVTIICLRNWIQYECDPNIKVITLCQQKRFTAIHYLSKLPYLVSQLNHVLHYLAKEYDVILLSSHLLYPNIITRLSSYHQACLYVIHASQLIVPYHDTWLYHRFLQWLYGNAKVITVGEGLKQEMMETYGLHQEKLRAIVNPLDFEKIDQQLKQKQYYPRPYLLFCGRLTAQKRVDRLIKAYHHGKFYEAYDLVIVGVGELQATLAQQVQTLGLKEHVYFAGWQDNVYAWMKNASLFVLSSDYEGLGMVLLEALYCECRIVSTDCPHGPSEIMVGELKPYLCELHSEALANKMKLALTTPYPNDLRSYTTKFHVKTNVETYIKTYQDWCEDAL